MNRLLKRRFVLIDRDGTVIEEREYLSEPDEVKLLPGAAGAMRELNELGLGLVIITNQSGVGRGFFNENRLGLIHARMVELLEREGVHLDGIYVCPHAPDDDCACRKPKTALAEKASAELGFDLRESFVVGDKASDIEMGRNIGATTVLVQTGYGRAEQTEGDNYPDHITADLAHAARIIRRVVAENSE